MYIKVEETSICCQIYRYVIYAANHRDVLNSESVWYSESACIRAAKKMARRLGIEYREVK